MSSFEFRALITGDGPYGEANRRWSRGPRRRSRKLIPRLDALEARTVLSTLWVTSNQDGAPGSLRAELGVASAGDTIAFAPSSYGTTKLTEGPLEVNTSVDIQGPGANKVTISGNQKSTAFNIPAGVTATISGLTVTEGSYDILYSVGGGAINNDGTLTLSDVVVSGNSLGSAAYGAGGINNDGTLTITGSTISGNTGNYAGGINNGGTLSITNSVVSNNSGGITTFGDGGIDSFAGSTSLTQSVVSGNTGGGIIVTTNYGYPTSTLTVTDSQIVDNTINQSGNPFGQAFGAGIYDQQASVTITGSNISNNVIEGSLAYGAGIYLGPDFAFKPTTSLTVIDTTFLDNQVIGTGTNSQGAGGAIHVDYDGTLSVSGSSFVGNTVTSGIESHGGAINLFTPLGGTITDCQFSGDQAIATSSGPYGGTGIGGAINNGGALTISGSTFTNNLAQGSFQSYGEGGAIQNDGSSAALTLSSDQFVGNQAIGGPAGPEAYPSTGGYGVGGALNDSFGASATVGACTFIGNTALGGVATGTGDLGGDGLGGAITGLDASLSVSHSTFLGNTAEGGAGSAGATGGNGEGGAIQFDNGALQVSDSSLVGNQAIGGAGGGAGEGGGAYVTGSAANASFTDVLISLNSALGGSSGGKGYGGGLYIATGAITTLTNSTVAGNFASTAGANVYGTYTNG
jgi:hypothetical protein